MLLMSLGGMRWLYMVCNMLPCSTLIALCMLAVLSSLPCRLQTIPCRLPVMLLHLSRRPWTLKPRVLIPCRVPVTRPEITPDLTVLLLPTLVNCTIWAMKLSVKTCTRSLLSDRQKWSEFGLFR